MEIVYFTIAGIALYFAADRLLDWMERRRGARFEHRSLIFFAVLLVLAVAVFQLIGRLAAR